MKYTIENINDVECSLISIDDILQDDINKLKKDINQRINWINKNARLMANTGLIMGVNCR